LATDIADIESDINSLRNRTVTVDGEDLLIRAAIRELSRRQLSTEEVASIAHQQAAETTAEVEEQLTNVQAAIEEVASREDTRMNIANEITSLRREVQSLKQNTDTNTETDTERRADTDTAEDDPVLVEPGQSDLRQNVRELQRENRAIKELIEGLNHNGQ
jgi:chromosome segregation ATPase